MFDIGGLELLLITVVALLVIGPERLPEALRTLGLGLGRLRRSFTSVKAEIEKEIGMDEVRRQLHNETVMDEMKRIEREVQNTVEEAKIDPNLGATSADQDEPSRDNTGEDDAPDNNADAATTPQEPMQIQPPVTPDSLADMQPPVTPDTISDMQPDMQAPAAPLPRSEAELEAAFERKQRAKPSESGVEKQN